MYNFKKENIQPLPYPLVEKDLVLDNVLAQAVELQEDCGIYDKEDAVELSLSKEDRAFVDSLDGLFVGCVEKNGEKEAVPVLFDETGRRLDTTLKELEEKISAVSVDATYLVDKGKQVVNPEYGLDYDREPAFKRTVLHPDIDIQEVVEKLQEYVRREEGQREPALDEDSLSL